jgi:hypothetical protein
MAETTHTADSQIFLWRSEALRNYASGHIFATGKTIDEARDRAMTAYKDYLSSDAWWGDAPDADGNFPDEEAREEYEAAIKAFEKDLAAEPHLGVAFLVKGSE